MNVATLAVAKVFKAPAVRSRRRLVRLCLVALVVLAGLASVPVAAAETVLPSCAEPVTVTESTPATIAAVQELQNAVVAECEASNRRMEVSQSVAHDDAWLIMGLLGSTVIAAAFYKVVLR